MQQAQVTVPTPLPQTEVYTTAEEDARNLADALKAAEERLAAFETGSSVSSWHLQASQHGMPKRLPPLAVAPPLPGNDSSWALRQKSARVMPHFSSRIDEPYGGMEGDVRLARSMIHVNYRPA